jgi:hypothetical protein
MISIAVFSMAAMALPVVAAPQDSCRTAGMVMVGVTVWDEDELHFLNAASADGSARAHAEADKMPTIGLGGQMFLSHEEAFDFGLEAGALFGCASDEGRAQADNGKQLLMVDVEWQVLDLFLGLFVQAGGDEARFTAGAGPLFLLGRLRRDAIEGNPAWYDSEVSSSEGIFGYGVYARAAVEFRVGAGWLGFGARGLLGEMNCDGVSDDADVRALQGLLSFAGAW